MIRRTRLPRTIAMSTCLLVAMALGAACSSGDDLIDDALGTPSSTIATDAPVDAPSSTDTDAPPTTRGRLPGKVGEHDHPGGDGTVPPDAPRFDPPHPTTTPNVEQPADSLLDGEHVAFMVDVDLDGRTVLIDVVQWIERDDYEQAIADGRLAADDPCLELDYCIANAQQRVRTMPVAADARVSIVDWPRCCGSVRTDNFDDVFVRMREGHDLFLLTVSGGTVVALDEIYLS